MKTCTGCGESKQDTDFYVCTSKKGTKYLAAECKACSKKRAAKWVAENPDKVRRKNRNRVRKAIGCTPEQYEQMYAEQEGCCGICGLRKDVLCVDHCHETGRIRGLLCHRCNLGLSHFEDMKERLMRAAAWVDVIYGMEDQDG